MESTILIIALLLFCFSLLLFLSSLLMVHHYKKIAIKVKQDIIETNLKIAETHKYFERLDEIKEDFDKSKIQLKALEYFRTSLGKFSQN
ncbi:hypothetical protein [Chryseobacterium sp. IT-36CA2]|uniref:hypothetical protein n=1 Tax=Chryseobacterium sp. IT-36CA2 TaxID=3026460 RepID=UPI0039DF9DD4